MMIDGRRVVVCSRWALCRRPWSTYFWRKINTWEIWFSARCTSQGLGHCSVVDERVLGHCWSMTIDGRRVLVCSRWALCRRPWSTYFWRKINTWEIWFSARRTSQGLRHCSVVDERVLGHCWSMMIDGRRVLYGGRWALWCRDWCDHFWRKLSTWELIISKAHFTRTQTLLGWRLTSSRTLLINDDRRWKSPLRQSMSTMMSRLMRSFLAEVKYVGIDYQ